jgi:hypothetical protein
MSVELQSGHNATILSGLMTECATRRQCELALFQYINGFDSPQRRHPALADKSLVTFERKATSIAARGPERNRDRSTLARRQVMRPLCTDRRSLKTAYRDARGDMRFGQPLYAACVT